MKATVSAATKQRVVLAIVNELPHRTIAAMSRIGLGRGIFAEVVRVTFADGEPSVVVKLADAGANGDAARRSGAYAREALAYRSLLSGLDVRHPACFAIFDDPLGPTLLLEDLSAFRFVDQLEGLSLDDALAVAASLGRLHRSSPDPVPATVRVNTVAGFEPTPLVAGLDSLRRQWSHVVPEADQRAFAALVDGRTRAVERFAEAGPPVLCHGDPRADNLAFDGADPILFDWQQIAVQPGVGDLAWLVATSLEPEHRLAADAQLIERYAQTPGYVVTTENYRAGFILPGLAALFLAQRSIDDSRTAAFVETSLRRIGRCLVDLDVASP